MTGEYGSVRFHLGSAGCMATKPAAPEGDCCLPSSAGVHRPVAGSGSGSHLPRGGACRLDARSDVLVDHS